MIRYSKIKNDKNMEILFSGSFKFFDEMKSLSQKLSKVGFKCILPKFSLQKSSNSKEIEKIKENRKQYGLRNGELEKIVEANRRYYERLKNCDLMIVVDINGYIGLSVAAEIGAAYILEKTVFFLEEPRDGVIKALLKISSNFKVVSLENIIDELKKLKDEKQKGMKEKIPSMTIKEAQEIVDKWINTIGVRYFSELTILAQLAEEVGEVARVISRTYGDQSFKKTDKGKNLADELADVLFVLICLANRTGIDLTEALQRNIEKKTKRDKNRHQNNPKLNQKFEKLIKPI